MIGKPVEKGEETISLKLKLVAVIFKYVPWTYKSCQIEYLFPINNYPNNKLRFDDSISTIQFSVISHLTTIVIS